MNGLNYFTNYALGLDPTKEDDKPIVDVSTGPDGKFVFTVKHPTYDEEGNFTGYGEISKADNVETSVKFKYGTSANSTDNEVGSTAIAPADMFSQPGMSGNVIYYKAEVTISAK